MTDKRKDCPMRHENGNCTVAGGFCTAVNDRLMPCEYCHESKNLYEIKSKLHDSMNTEIYITGESLVVDIIYHSYGTADIKLRLMFGRNLKEGADNDT